MENKTKVFCSLTSCTYNSSCCSCPAKGEDHTCTNSSINVLLDEYGSLECSEYIDNYEKDVECYSCQIKKYNGIRVTNGSEFDIVDSE